MNVTKLDLSKNIAKKFPEETIDHIKSIIEALFEEVLITLSDGKKIEIRGFGVFSVKKRKARIGRNPRTGVTVQIPENKKFIFKFSKEALKRKMG